MAKPIKLTIDFSPSPFEILNTNVTVAISANPVNPHRRHLYKAIIIMMLGIQKIRPIGNVVTLRKMIAIETKMSHAVKHQCRFGGCDAVGGSVSIISVSQPELAPPENQGNKPTI